MRLYGPRRTLIKIRGQRHVERSFESLPVNSSKNKDKKHIGIIGCGNFAFTNIAYYIKKNYGDVIRAAMDININRAASLFKSYSLLYFTDSAKVLLSDPEINLIYIASNHASHAEYAIAAIKAGKSVHIEKPHVVTEDQLIELCLAIKKFNGKIGLGFNRPKSLMGQKIKERIDKERGPVMFNWFVAGHVIDPEHWYFDEKEGGRVLSNLCHWTDFVYQMTPKENRFPIIIKATTDEKSGGDVAVTYVFGDGSIASITFSSKGHTFEGVRERFNAQRGDLLIFMEDFQKLVFESGQKKTKFKNRYRDQGHEQTIIDSYNLTGSGDARSGASIIPYLW
jgi:predicted dehydrogenase